jgi:hypothetical protein
VPSLAPATHQDEWSTGLPASCGVVALCVPVLVGQVPEPGPAPDPCTVARTARSSQARRHARRTIQVTTVTTASTPTHTNAINTTPPSAGLRPDCPQYARRCGGLKRLLSKSRASLRAVSQDVDGLTRLTGGSGNPAESCAVHSVPDQR